MRKRRTQSFPEVLRMSNEEYFSKVLNDETEETESDTESSNQSWVDSFLERTHSNWLCRVPDSFLLDNFNLYGLSKIFPRYERCIEIIRDISQITDEELLDPEQPTIDSILQGIYYIIHSRYIQSNSGLKAMKEKYEKGIFGKCPRIECHGQKVIATGASSSLGVFQCCVYCPRCQDVYHTPDIYASQLDSAAFGSSYGPLFFRTFPNLNPHEEPVMPEKTVFGFKINKSKLRGVHPLRTYISP